MACANSTICSSPKDPAVFRPTGFADLAGRRVGIFGVGIEGRATAWLLRPVAASLILVDDNRLADQEVLVTSEGGFEALLSCDVVIKSPGIARRRPDVLDLELHGVAVVSALNLWLHDADRTRIVAITGTKGKSTTTALMTFFLHCLNEPALRLGNIGQPPYDPSVDTSSGWLVVEVSSFQCVDIDVAPAIVVVTSLGADHLDWHGSVEQYRRDKLSLTRCSGPHATLVPDNPTFRALTSELGGELEFVEADSTHLAQALGLLGSHSNSNVALALDAVARLTHHGPAAVAAIVRQRAFEFEPLRGRLTLAAVERSGGALGVRYVDDGLATSVLPTIAALEVFVDEPVALIAGGFDRGVDYGPLAAALVGRRATTVLVTMGPAGERIGDALRQLDANARVHQVDNMFEAVQQARRALVGEGVVLLSPAAPSFDRYKDWEERSEDFSNVARELASEWSDE
jgi:UDP-N-acetylmuramoylalanine--D-glutamate ligase